MVKFDIKQTNIAKGVALLLLLWHHLFYNNPNNYNDFKSLYVFNGKPIECILADFCKVCVAMFLILSGYGLYKSYASYIEKQKNQKGVNRLKNSVIYTKNRLIKLLSDYWFIYIIFVPLGLIFGRSFIDIYANNPVHYISDIFGISLLINGSLDYTMNETWWYMSICIVYYILFPFIYRLMNKYAEVVLVFSLILIFLPFDYVGLTTWLFSFVIGMYFAKYNLFEKLVKTLNNDVNKLLFSAFSTLFCAYYRKFLIKETIGPTAFDGFFGLSIILFTYFVISEFPIINRILEELGKYSGMIFMFHSFIFAYYFKKFIYGFKYSLLIYLVLTVICYVIARLIAYLQHLIKYDKLMNKLMKQ